MIVVNNLMAVSIVYVLVSFLFASSSALFHNRQSVKPSEKPFNVNDNGNGKLRRRNVDYSSRSQKIARSGGDFVLGVLLPVHKSRRGPCSELYRDGAVLTEVIVFALREVRRRKLLPKNITLGYEIRDTCNSVKVAQRHSLDLVLEATKQRQTDDCTSIVKQTRECNARPRENNFGGKVIAVVGAGSSELSVAVNRVLSAFDIPQIGFAATSRFLSEKLRFPSFFRTVPPDTLQVEALVALFQKFSWNYAGLLVSDGNYGRPLAESFKAVAKVKGICIDFERLVPYKVNHTRADIIVRELSLKSQLEIIVILLPELAAKTILTAMLKIGLRNKTLIATESWSKSNDDAKFSEILKGTLGFAHHNVQVREFEEYFLSLKPQTNTWNPWFNETWEHLFTCKLLDGPQAGEKLSDRNGTVKKSQKIMPCNLKQQHLRRERFIKFHHVLNLVNAVFSVAHGVRQFCQSLPKSNTSSIRQSCLASLNAPNLLGELQEMTFRGYDGKDIAFDKNGDVEGKYDLVNILPGLGIKSVGIWEGGRKGGTLSADVSSIVWNSVQQTPPEGVCAEPCSPGWYQLSSKTGPQCCWKCQRCHEGTISKKSGATGCISCGEHLMSNFNRTACTLIPVNYLDWQSSWTVSIVFFALIAVSLLIFVAILFVRHANTPVVKSSNRELSFLLCLGLLITLLVPFAFAGKPTGTKCAISQIMFCVGTALALSAMLFKTLRIVLVFEFGNRRTWLLKNIYGIALTLLLTFAELTYCLLWVAINPPDVNTVLVTHTNRYLVCKFDKLWYGGSHLLLITLSLVCTGMAVRGRKLPKSFNEVKHITLSMFTFNIVWVVFKGAQYGASLEYDVKMNCFAMIVSSFMILVLLFGPKVFFLLFRPHLNRKEEFQEQVRRYSFRHSSINALDADGIGSLGSLSMPSSRRGSLVNSHGTSFGKGRLLSVPNGSTFLEVRRGQTIDAAASGIYHSSQGLPCFQKPQTDSLRGCASGTSSEVLTEITPILVKITRPDDNPPEPSCGGTSSPLKEIIVHGGRPFCATQGDEVTTAALETRRRCKCCHQKVKECLSLSLPNFCSVHSLQSHMVFPVDTTSRNARPRSPFSPLNDSIKVIPTCTRQSQDQYQLSETGEELAINHDNGEFFGDEIMKEACERGNLLAGKELLKNKNRFDCSDECLEKNFSETSPLRPAAAFKTFSRNSSGVSNSWNCGDVDTAMPKFIHEFSRETKL